MSRNYKIHNSNCYINRLEYVKPSFRCIAFDFDDIIAESCTSDEECTGDTCPGAVTCPGHIPTQSNNDFSTDVYSSDVYSTD